MEYTSKKLLGAEYRVMVKTEVVKAIIADHMRNKALYVHDRDKAHTAKKTHRLLRRLRKKIGVIEKLLGTKCWIFNPIERVWGILTMEVYDGGHKSYNTLDELRSAVAVAWEKIQQEHHTSIQRMIDVIPRDIDRMIAAGGAHIDSL